MESVHGQVSSGTGVRLVLRSRLGAITLALLCAVQFLDIADSAIVNVALPSIQHSLDFSQQNLQWVASGYILTYGGFLLLGGRLGDLLGRRRMLLTGLAVFAVSSLTAGLADSAGLLVAARLVQGIGAALMAPAALSELTTSFREGKDRNTALGVWGAISGMAAAAGVFLGGVISQGPGWRWVFFVNPPICVAVAAGAFALLAKERGGRTGTTAFDSQGAVLVTGGMLLLVYGLVRAPIVGWGSIQTIFTLIGSATLIVAFALNELRSRNPLVPFAILRVKGLVAADLTQLIAFTGFFSMFFYATLYMQEILHYSPLKAGAAYLPITAGFAVAGGMASQLVTRIGTRPVVAVGCLIGGRAAEFLPAGRQRAGPGHPLCRRNHPQQPPDCSSGITCGGVRCRIPPGPARRQHLDGSCGPARPAHRQHPELSPAGHGQHGSDARAGASGSVTEECIQTDSIT
jgi:EmrB/QacA subfamily drug resistance transporter